VLEWLYRRYPSAFVARRNLTRNRVRSALTVLGITIGVVAVASLGIFGNTLQADLTGSLSDIGSTVVVAPAQEEGYRSVEAAQVRRIRRAAPDAAVTPLKQRFQTVSVEDKAPIVRVYGLDDPRRVVEAERGRVPADFRDGLLLGTGIADELGVEVGDRVTVGDQRRRVTAVLESDPSAVVSASQAAFVPSEGFGDDSYSLVLVDGESAQAANETAMALRADLNDRGKRVVVRELSDQVDQIRSVFSTLNVFLTGVAAISLFVAGVGILNVMLMSAVERRQEVGVLRAVGLRRRDVLRVMLIEAVLLGAAGSLVGGLISFGAGLAVNDHLLGDPTRVLASGNVVYLAFAVGFGVAIGLGSGLYPAWKASRERPVEALRH
jgi:putative ABC transport system permease protein